MSGSINRDRPKEREAIDTNGSYDIETKQQLSNNKFMDKLFYMLRWSLVKKMFFKWAPMHIFFFIAGYISLVGDQIADKREQVLMGQVLPDVLYDLIPPPDPDTHKFLYEYVDTVILFFSISTISMGIFFRPGRRLLVYHQTVFTYYCIMLLRSTTVWVTSVPDPYHDCRYRPPITKSYLWLLIPRTSIYPTCGDLLFSGHTSLLVTFAMVWTYETNRLFSLLAWLLAASGVIVLIITRYHYVVDCLLGFYISVMLYTITAKWFRVFHKTDSYRETFKFMFGNTFKPDLSDSKDEFSIEYRLLK